jgi:hypothetical protein
MKTEKELLGEKINGLANGLRSQQKIVDLLREKAFAAKAEFVQAEAQYSIAIKEMTRMAFVGLELTRQFEELEKETKDAAK